MLVIYDGIFQIFVVFLRELLVFGFLILMEETLRQTYTLLI